MRNLIFTFLILFGICSQAQKLDLNAPLPLDKTFIKGVLPNGMTYYIKKTDVVKNVASYYIIQNVGSILENEDQRGLAHFLEHMAFNGTKNFPGKGILNTLQKHGAVFGRDINAYTGFDETVYNLSNISTKDGLIDTCLLVLHDWSDYLSLTDKEIDNERGVIKEEWRSRQNGQMRLMKKSLPIIYNNSKYAKRMPIGLMSVVENFKYKALRDFYHDWYRTDLQAIAVVGDIDVAEIEQKIKNRFSKIPAVKNPKKRFVVDIPDNDKLLYNIGTDPEVSTSSISLSIRDKKPSVTNTVAGLKQDLLEYMAVSILNNRISEKKQDPNASFSDSSVGSGPFTRTSNIFQINIFPKPDKQQAAFKDILTEVIRAVKFGYTSSEIKRANKAILSYFQTMVTQIADTPHNVIIGSIKDNYLKNIAIVDIKKIVPIVKSLLSDIKPEEIHQAIRRLFSDKNRVLNVTGVKTENNLSEQQALEILNSLENDSKLKPYVDTSTGKTLLSGIDIKAGKIIKTEQNNLLKSTTFTLSNGIKVHYKFTDKDKNSVSLRATSYGGKSLLKADELPSADMATNLVSSSGLGDYSNIELEKILTGKMTSLSMSLDNITEGIYGGSTTKDLETMLQQLYLSFEKPRFDKKQFQLLKQRLNISLLRNSKDIDSKVSDKENEIIYGKNNPRVRFFDKKYIDDISFDKIKQIYKERFANPADFDFYIVGDVKTEQLKPLISKYIASLPTTDERENFKNKTPDWTSDKIDKDAYLEMKTPKTYVSIYLRRKIPFSLKNDLVASLMGKIFTLRLTETLREEQGGVYSPSAFAGLQKRPVSQVYAGASFVCNPDLADKLVKITNDEFKKIVRGIIDQKDLDKTKTSFLEDRKKSKNNNGYAMSLLTNFYRDNFNMNDPNTFENIIKSISKEDIQKMAEYIYQGGKSYQIVIKPKK